MSNFNQRAFNPQPEPPGFGHYSFNPQPDPPPFRDIASAPIAIALLLPAVQA